MPPFMKHEELQAAPALRREQGVKRAPGGIDVCCARSSRRSRHLRGVAQASAVTLASGGAERRQLDRLLTAAAHPQCRSGAASLLFVTRGGGLVVTADDPAH
jgi:hypothetical protein